MKTLEDPSNMEIRLCACKCGQQIPEMVLARARMLGNEHTVKYASPTHRNRQHARNKRAKKIHIVVEESRP